MGLKNLRISNICIICCLWSELIHMPLYESLKRKRLSFLILLLSLIHTIAHFSLMRKKILIIGPYNHGSNVRHESMIKGWGRLHKFYLPPFILQWLTLKEGCTNTTSRKFCKKLTSRLLQVRLKKFLKSSKAVKTEKFVLDELMVGQKMPKEGFEKCRF